MYRQPCGPGKDRRSVGSNDYATLKVHFDKIVGRSKLRTIVVKQKPKLTQRLIGTKEDIGRSQ